MKDPPNAPDVALAPQAPVADRRLRRRHAGRWQFRLCEHRFVLAQRWQPDRREFGHAALYHQKCRFALYAERLRQFAHGPARPADFCGGTFRRLRRDRQFLALGGDSLPGKGRSHADFQERVDGGSGYSTGRTEGIGDTQVAGVSARLSRQHQPDQCQFRSVAAHRGTTNNQICCWPTTARRRSNAHFTRCRRVRAPSMRCRASPIPASWRMVLGPVLSRTSPTRRQFSGMALRRLPRDQRMGRL